MIKDWYYYYKLPKRLKNAYELILKGINNELSFISLDPIEIKPEEIEKVVLSIELDNPDIFFVDFHKFTFGSNGQFITSININHIYSKKDKRNLQKLITKSLNGIHDKLNIESLDEYTKEIQIYEFLEKNITYDYSSLNSSFDSFEFFKANSIIGSLLDKNATCLGISKGLKLVLNSFGIRSIVVTGIGKSNNIGNMENHAWNIVKIHDENYHVDLTWDITLKSTRMSYDYFNLTDSLVCKDHKCDDIALPICNSTKYNYFSVNNLVMNSENDLSNYLNRLKNRNEKYVYIKLNYKCNINDVIRKIASVIAVNGNANSSFVCEYNLNQGIVKVGEK